jgi:UDP-N-acetylglucosamine 3-dehydrogenase
MIKVGVIGLGAMGKNHVRVYSELPDVELAGIADVDQGASPGRFRCGERRCSHLAPS